MPSKRIFLILIVIIIRIIGIVIGRLAALVHPPSRSLLVNHLASGFSRIDARIRTEMTNEIGAVTVEGEDRHPDLAAVLDLVIVKVAAIAGSLRSIRFHDLPLGQIAARSAAHNRPRCPRPGNGTMLAP
jgi:hypothetical protein